MAYLISRFQLAVTALCGRGPVKQRLATAFALHLSDVHDDELGPEQRAVFAALKQKLHRVTPLNGEGPVRASVRKMSPQEASDCAATIVELFVQLSQHDAERTPLHLVESEFDRVAEIPKFLAKS